MSNLTITLTFSLDKMIEDINQHLCGWLECAEETSDTPLSHEGRYIVLKGITNSKGEKVKWSLPLTEIHTAYHNYGAETTCHLPIPSIQKAMDEGKGTSGIVNLWKTIKGI